MFAFSKASFCSKDVDAVADAVDEFVAAPLLVQEAKVAKKNIAVNAIVICFFIDLIF